MLLGAVDTTVRATDEDTLSLLRDNVELVTVANTVVEKGVGGVGGEGQDPPSPTTNSASGGLGSTWTRATTGSSTQDRLATTKLEST